MKKLIRNLLLKHLLKAIVLSDVLKMDEKTGVMTLGGEKLTENELRGLKEEAGYIKRTRLWSVLTNTLQDQAHTVMFQKSKNWEDMVTGKTMLYNIDIQEKIIDMLLKK
jgi:hypothetical protein